MGVCLPSTGVIGSTDAEDLIGRVATNLCPWGTSLPKPLGGTMKAKMAADEGTVSALMEHSTLCCSAGVDYCLMICFVLVRLRALGMH